VERATSPLASVAMVNSRNTVRKPKKTSETDTTAATNSAMTAIALTNMKSRGVFAVSIFTDPRKKIRWIAAGRKPWEM